MNRFGVIHFAFCLGGWFVFTTAQAAESLNQSTIQIFKRPQEIKKYVTRFDVSLTQTRYAGAPQITEQGKSYSSVIPSIQIFNRFGSPENPHSEIYADGLAVLPMSDGVDFGIAVPELYYRWVVEPQRLSWGVGRKKTTWSELDSNWNLGLWQPLVRWDAANPIEQGLTGLFIDLESENVRTSFMLSGLFLPDQQPSHEEKDGSIVSSNRWFRAPVSNVAMQRTSGQVNYQVREPDIEDVVFQSTYAFKFEVGDLNQGLFTRIAYTDKPANQFHLTLQGSLDFMTIEYDVPIVPISVRHRIYGLEAGYRNSDSKLVLSNQWEFYDKPTVLPNWEQTELLNSQYWGADYTQALGRLGLPKTNVGLALVGRTVSARGNSDSFIQGDIESSTQRFQFDRFFALKMNTNLRRTFKHELDLSMKYVQSLADSGEWIQAGLIYRYDRRWYWSFSGDVFGVPDETPASSSFISKFRGNDRLAGGLTYVF